MNHLSALRGFVAPSPNSYHPRAKRSFPNLFSLLYQPGFPCLSEQSESHRTPSSLFSAPSLALPLLESLLCGAMSELSVRGCSCDLMSPWGPSQMPWYSPASWIRGGLTPWNGPLLENYCFPQLSVQPMAKNPQSVLSAPASQKSLEGGRIRTSGIETTKWASDLAEDARRHANGPGGRCYQWVADALSRKGIELYGLSAYMAGDQLAKRGEFKEVKGLPFSEIKKLPPGCILVSDRGPGHPHGHIAITLGKGEEASDKLRRVVNIGTKIRVFVPQR